MEKQKKGVRLDHISKIYTDPKTGKEFYAVQDTTLDIEPGSFVTLLGPSGCGKTTTLRMIAGFESPDEGDIYLGDENINALTPNKRDTAMVFQSYALLPHYNVFDNVAYGLKIRKLPKEEIHERVMNILKLVEMDGMESRMTNQLSGGQQQRVALARAIVIHPEVLLMDEPLSNLDAKLRNQMRAEIIKLRQRIDTTFIYVTHDQTEAMTLGDRIVIMKDGFIQQVGTPQEVFDHPLNVFVAGFIGMPQMNFFDAHLVKDGDGYYVNCSGSKVELPEKIQEKLKASNAATQDIVLGIRPEHISFVPASQSEGTLVGTVDVSEMMGSELHLHVSVEQDNGTVKDVVMRLSTSDLPDEFRGGIPYGTQLHFTFPGTLVHMFNKDTEENLI